MADKPQPSTGPWYLDQDAAHPWIVRAKYDDGLPGSAELFRVGYRPNAVLAAAAPDMRKALEAIRAGYPKNSNAYKIADQALAKVGL